MEATELATFQSDPETEHSIGVRLTAMDRELEEMSQVLGSMSVQVESEDDLYLYLEKLQILKAQILNKRHQLSTLLSVNEDGDRAPLQPEDAERVSQMLAVISTLDSEVSEELDVAHTVREKFATFGRVSLKVLFYKYFKLAIVLISGICAGPTRPGHPSSSC